jgi:hypothetical protein
MKKCSKLFIYKLYKIVVTQDIIHCRKMLRRVYDLKRKKVQVKYKYYKARQTVVSPNIFLISVTNSLQKIGTSH